MWNTKSCRSVLVTGEFIQLMRTTTKEDLRDMFHRQAEFLCTGRREHLVLSSAVLRSRVGNGSYSIQTRCLKTTTYITKKLCSLLCGPTLWNTLPPTVRNPSKLYYLVLDVSISGT